MASKLIRGDQAARAEPIAWRGAHGKTPVRAAGEAPHPMDDPRSSAAAAHQARIQELEHELDMRPRKAYEQGYVEGQAAAFEQANARIEPVMAKLAQSLGSGRRP
jgi:hypothetical protein